LPWLRVDCSQSQDHFAAKDRGKKSIAKTNGRG
jgi:hypothetical protein